MDARVGLRGKYPGGTSRLVESGQEGVGHCQNAQCREDADRVRKREEQRNGKRAERSKGETKAPGDGETREQEDEVWPGDGEPLVPEGELRHADMETVRRGSPEGNRSQETELL
ncbi:hypothetical protein NDU88_001835 [Pleurodeles waltl]|uniref:Uncharacterized protein n=1 Tax=Pleurodeles waltl TaxID=8319 RepID=A0AAV7LDY8_PLEWA|nr:hypothetical protein NDU88_001835 [Pleurodeles waltl]